MRPREFKAKKLPVAHDIPIPKENSGQLGHEEVYKKCYMAQVNTLTS